jgi:F-type H+-transporting ATPase subunit b
MYRFVAAVIVVVAVSVSTRLTAEETPKESPAGTVGVAEVQHAESGDTAIESEVASESGHAKATHGPESATDARGTSVAHDVRDDVHSEHGGGQGGHFDSTDLSHANASAKLNEPDEFKSDLAIWTFVVFLGLLLILGKFAWGPVMDGLDKREQTIASMVDEAKRGQEQAAEQLRQYEAKLAAAGEEARELVAQARKDAEVAKDRILVEAQQAADRQRQRAIEDIQVAKDVALREITERGADLAVNLAGRIVRQQLRAEDHSLLIQEAMDQFTNRN